MRCVYRRNLCYANSVTYNLHALRSHSHLTDQQTVHTFMEEERQKTHASCPNKKYGLCHMQNVMKLGHISSSLRRQCFLRVLFSRCLALLGEHKKKTSDVNTLFVESWCHAIWHKKCVRKITRWHFARTNGASDCGQFAVVQVSWIKIQHEICTRY